MDTLPLELVGLIISCCPPIVQPLTALVCRGWNRMMERNRTLLLQRGLAHFYRPMSCGSVPRYVPQCRRAQDDDYRDKLADAKRTIYACRLVKTRHRALIEWAFTDGGFDVTAAVISKAAATGDLGLLKWIVVQYKNGAAAAATDLYYRITRGAAKIGSIDILEWAHTGRDATFRVRLPSNPHKSAIAAAAKYNQREAIEWLRAHGHTLHADVSALAAAAGHVDLLRWLHGQGCPMGWNNVRVATGLADLDALDWFGEGGERLYRLAYRETVPGDCLARLVRVYAENGKIGPEAWLFAVERGDMVMCEWLLGIDCPGDGQAFVYATFDRRLDTMLWLRDHGFVSKPRDFYRCALKGDIDALEWFSHRGFDLDGNYMAIVAGCEGHTDVLERLCARDPTVTLAPCAVPASHANRWDTVKWLCDQGYALTDPELCANAVLSKRLDMVEYLRVHGCPWDEWSCASAAETGQLHTLQWLRARGCPWNVNTCVKAIKGRHYPIVDWALDNGCPFDTRMCASAAAQGDIHYLKHLRQRGVPWDDFTCYRAALGGQLETLQWAIANRCPHSLEECRDAAMYRGHKRIVDWIGSLSLTSL